MIEGRANYLLFRADETLGERLEKLGVVVRRCGNYPGLDDSWYRTAVRTRRENDALLAAAAGGDGMSRAKRIMVQGT